MSAVNYRLELPTQWSIHPVFHIDLLTPYKETIMHGPNFTRPAPELIDGEEEYSVEKILDSRHFGRRWRLQYLVKWEGYLDAENMWVDKDDVFADDKVREFKASNPDSATHIRSTSVTKSPHFPTSARSHLLHQHALTYMSSDGNMTSPMSTLQEPLLTPLSHFRKRTPSTPLSLSLSPSSTSSLSNPWTPPLPSLVLDLSLHPPQPQMSQPCSTNLGSTPLPLSHPTDNASLTRPAKCLLFRSPLPKGEGVKQALAWNREQLLDLRRLWELRRQRRINHSQIPMTHPPTMISNAALAVGNSKNTATATPLSSQTHPSTSHLTPLESHCRDPFRPTAWRDLTSVVRRPQHWQLASPPVSGKTTKMPLRFRHLTTTRESSRGLSPKDLASRLMSLPKGWVYETEEVAAAVKVEVTDPSQYLTPDAPLTRGQLKTLHQQDDPHCRLRQALSITEDHPSFPSASVLTPAVKRKRVTSAHTSTLLTPL
jgi:hypothetical protein